jgi:acyl-CoA-dependent ceramide synthase
MMVHHVITTLLIFSSWNVNFVRVGIAIMVEQDLADIFLPLAKCFKYLGLPTLGDIWFAVFAVIWYPTRHFLFFLLYYSICTQCPVFEYDPENNIIFTKTMWQANVLLLGIFQVRGCVCVCVRVCVCVHS